MDLAANQSSVAASNERIAAARRWCYAIVLLGALLVSAGQPLVSDLLGERSFFDLGVTLLIMSVLLLAFEPGMHRRAARILGVAAFVSLGVTHLAPPCYGGVLLIASYLLTGSLFALTLWSIVRTMLAGHASGDAILAAVCGYLLLGIIWTLLYQTLEAASQGSFRGASASGEESTAPDSHRGDLGYFSFITLATVGYGDILPVSRPARTLAWLEAVTGQFYLAVLVAGLVGIRVSRDQPTTPEQPVARSKSR
jgi:voltage-gated potassium channel